MPTFTCVSLNMEWLNARGPYPPKSWTWFQALWSSCLFFYFPWCTWTGHGSYGVIPFLTWAHLSLESTEMKLCEAGIVTSLTNCSQCPVGFSDELWTRQKFKWLSSAESQVNTQGPCVFLVFITAPVQWGKTEFLKVPQRCNASCFLENEINETAGNCSIFSSMVLFLF